MIIPNIWENRKCSKPPTRCVFNIFQLLCKKKCCSHGFFRLQQRGSSCRSLFFLLAHLSGRKIPGLVNWQKMGHRNSWFTFDSDIRYVNVYQRVSLGKFLDAISCHFPHLLFICGNGLSDTDKSRSIARATCFGHLLDLLGFWKRWHRNKLVWKCLLSSDIEILEDIKRISKSFQIHVYPSLSILILVGWWDIFWSFPWNPITNHAGVVLPPHLALLATSANIFCSSGRAPAADLVSEAWPDPSPIFSLWLMIPHKWGFPHIGVNP